MLILHLTSINVTLSPWRHVCLKSLLDLEVYVKFVVCILKVLTSILVLLISNLKLVNQSMYACNRILPRYNVQWNVCNPTPEFSRHPVTSDKNIWSQSRSVNINKTWVIRHIFLVPWCVGLDRFHCIYIFCI